MPRFSAIAPWRAPTLRQVAPTLRQHCAKLREIFKNERKTDTFTPPN